MLAEVLRRHGYGTAAVTGGGILHPDFGFAQGFDRFDYWGDPESDREIEWVFGSAKRWIEDHRDRQFFLFVHTYEIHAPHRRREPFFSTRGATSSLPATTSSSDARAPTASRPTPPPPSCSPPA